MKKILGVVSVMIVVSLVLGCAVATDPMGELADARFTISAAEKDGAVELTPTQSARKNASGPKITSNAHSADFPGVYFIWDSKQKDDGYLKVNMAVLRDLYEGFIFTVKEANNYYDYDVTLGEGQDVVDGVYVFKIAKTGDKNINMVFIPEIKIQNETTVKTEEDVISAESEEFAKYFRYDYTVTMQKIVDGKAWTNDLRNFDFFIGENKAELVNGLYTFAVNEPGPFMVKENINLMTNKYLAPGLQPVVANITKGTIEYSRSIGIGDFNSIEYFLTIDLPGESEIVDTFIEQDGEELEVELLVGNRVRFMATSDTTINILVNFKTIGEVNTFTNELNGFGNGGGNKGTATNVSKKTPFHDENTKTYATLNKADLEAGYVTLNMYRDNAGLAYIGKAFVELVNGQLVITLDGEGAKFTARATYDSKGISSLHTNGNNSFDLKNGDSISIGGTAGDTIYLYVWGEANFYTVSEK